MKRLAAVALAVVAVIGSSAGSVNADGTSYCSMGKDYTITIDGTQTTKEMGVFSAGAVFSPGLNGTGGTGREAMRMWTRTQNVYEYYRDYNVANYTFVRTQFAQPVQMDFRFFTDDSRRGQVWVSGNKVYPRPASSSLGNPIVNDLVGDALNYYFPAGTFYKLIANGFVISSVAHANPQTYDYTVSVRGQPLDKSITDLPTSVSWSDADKLMDGKTSGQKVEWEYTFTTLASNGYNLQLWPQGNIQYRVNNFEYGFSVDHYYWTNPMYARHVVNPQTGWTNPCWNPN